MDCAAVDAIAVADGAAGKLDVFSCGKNVFGPHRAGECQPAGHVIVVDVRLQHVSDPHIAGQLQHPIDVALRVDDDGYLTIAHQIAAITQPGGFDDRYIHHVCAP